MWSLDRIVKLLHAHAYLVYVGHQALVSRETDDYDVYNELILEPQFDTVMLQLNVKILLVDL